MNKKGFVLMETIVVIVVISVALLTIFSSYNKILRKVKTENKYDTSEYVYMTNYIKEYLEDKSVTISELYPCTVDSTTGDEICDVLDINPITISESTISNFNVEKVYILTDINNFDSEVNGINNSEYFDAYMIDYIRKLDVGDNDTILIVEYKRPSMDINYETKKMYSNNITGGSRDLNETYIASLEW